MARKTRKLYIGHVNSGESRIPEIYVHAVEGKALDQKRALVRDITAAVVYNFDLTPGTVMVQIVESLKENKAKGGVLFKERPVVAASR